MWSGKPYNFFGDYLRNKFEGKIFKLPVNAGLSCPNRDGTLGNDGCIFCSNDGSAAATCVGEDIHRQMQAAKDLHRRADSNTRYIVYFQAFTNTYARLDKLKELYSSALVGKNAAGLMIATRPDCLPDEVIELIASYNKDDFELWVELGMQTCHDKSLRFLNRRHTHAVTEDAVRRLAAKGIKVCLHIILGIPQETWQDMMETADKVSAMQCDGVKLHHLYVIKGTPLEKIYAQGNIPMLSLKEYVSAVCDFIERLRPDILIHRLMGNAASEKLAAPLWGLEKGTVLKAVTDEFTKRQTFQGFLLRHP